MIRRAAVEKLAIRWTKHAGGSSFEVRIPLTDPDRAFREAVNDASHMSGHGGYSGTIAEKHDFKILSRTPLAPAEIQDYVEKHIDANEKYGPAFAVPYTDQTVVGEKGFVVRVKARNEHEAFRAAREAVIAKGPTKTGTTIVVDMPWGGAKKLKPGGTAEIRFEKSVGPAVYAVGAREVADLKTAEALVRDMLTNSPRGVGDWLVIRKVQTVGKATLTGTASRLPTWEVTGTRKTVSSSGRIVGWLFFGTASS